MGIPVSPVLSLDVTNRFVLDIARSHGGCVLDYGCGAGAVVAGGIAEGLDVWGTDIFYGGSAIDRTDAARTGLFGDRVREMGRDGRIPFAEATFDLVTNNQVMEHVDDLEATLGEIHRVLKPGGTVLSMFPARDVWREGHIGIPFAHRLPVGSTTRLWYTRGLRAAGFGTFKDGRNSTDWALEKLGWIDSWTRYRPREQIFAAYAQYFESELRERDYIRYRLLVRPGVARKLLAATTRVPGVSDLEQAIFRKLAFLVIVSRKY
jgi:SAM-dependent methyltransferase